MLGWANERKIEALTAQLIEQQAEFTGVQQVMGEVEAERDRLEARSAALSKLEEYSSWRELDWQASRARADEAGQERERLLAGSDRLEEIEQQLADNKQRGHELDREMKRLARQRR